MTINSPSRILLDYWKSISTTDIPSRRDFNPKKIQSILPNIAIYDKHSKDGFAIRLWGTKLTDAFGFDATNKPISVILLDDHVESYVNDLNILLSQRCGLMKIRRLAISGDKFLFSRSILLPIKDRKGQSNNIILVVEFKQSLHPEEYIKPNNPETAINYPPRFLDIGFGLPE